MQIDSIKTSLYKLNKLMCGFNFEVSIGIEYFENCFSDTDFKIELKHTFPNSQPESLSLLEIDHDSFWEEINFCLSYRGDESVGYYLGPENQEKILEEQNHYINFLRNFISPTSKILSYPDDPGIPGYPVWWDYRFIIMQENGQCIFTYGSASD